MSNASTEQQDTYTSECPYCGKQFTAETRMEADNKEGIHRTEDHVQDGEIERVIDGKTSEVDDWRREVSNNKTEQVKAEESKKANGADKLIDEMRSSQDDDAEVA